MKKEGGRGFPRIFSISANKMCPPSRTGTGSIFKIAKFTFSRTAKDSIKEMSVRESL